MQAIDMTQLYQASKSLGPKDLILDVRTPEEFAEGHVPGARNIPVAELESRAKELAGVDHLYVYCRSGGRVRASAGILSHAGIDSLRIGSLLLVVDGGFPDWEDQGFPVQK